MSEEDKTNVQSGGDTLTEHFVPPSDWDRKKESDTLILMLPGFRKEQLKVQVSSDRVLRLSGERKISENKWRRFRKEEKLTDYHDTSGINAKFEAGMLYVRLPKIIKQEEPSKPDQQQTTPPDHKPHSQQPSSDQKEPKDQEQTKTEAQTPPLVQEPKEDHHHDENSQKKPEKEQGKASVPEDKTKTSEANKEMHETIQTALKDMEKYFQNKLTQKEEDHEDLHEKTLKQKELDHEDVQKLTQKELDDDVQKKLSQKKNEKGGSGSGEGLSKRSVVKMKQWLDMVYGLVEELKKQNKMPHFVSLIFLVLVIGLYIKSLLKSSFGGAKDQDQEF